MTVRLDLQSIKKIISNQYFILGLIVVLAYILRVLPYLLGYPFPFAEEGMRDFEQIKYLIENGQLNLFGSYYGYGAFPVLHLLIFALSHLGLNALTAFLFIPQIFACLGIVFFYFFLKKYLSVKPALLACFLITVFIPNIYWTSQPMRETIGLFFFPLVIYLFDAVFASIDDKKSVILKFTWLIVALLMVIPAHHGSTIMLAGWLLFYILFFIHKTRKKIQAIIIWLIFAILSGAFWYFLFPIGLERLRQISYGGWMIMFLGLAVAIVISLRKNEFNLDILRKSSFKIGVIFLVIISFIFAYISAPLVYPIQIWFSFLIFAIITIIGFFDFNNNFVIKLVLASGFYFLAGLIGIGYIISDKDISLIPFDPFRILEFIIFPVSVLGGLGIIRLFRLNKAVTVFLVFFLIVLATAAYPSIFVYGTNFSGTIFYDIRSDIRYISPKVVDLIAWANERGFSVVSPITEINTYQTVFYPQKIKTLVIKTNNDINIKQKLNYINSPISGVLKDVYKNDLEKDYSIIYQNQDGQLLVSNYGAEFIEQKVPELLVFKVGQKIDFSFTMKNTGPKTWLLEEKFFLQEQHFKAKMKLDHTVSPGEIVTFVAKDFVVPDNTPSNFKISLQLYKEGFGSFGESTPSLDVSIIK